MLLNKLTKCYADSDPCDLNTDLKPTKVSVEIGCVTGVHVTRSGGYINGSVGGLRIDSRQ